MLYFIFWVLFLLVVAFAVPVVSFLEKRKYAAANPAPEPDPDMNDDDIAVADADDDPGFAEADDSFGADPAAEFGEIEATGGDDFSAFDEEFK